MTSSQRNLWTALLAASAFATLFSLSFVATPVKFMAENVPIAHLLAVGRVTFWASLVIESALLAILFLTACGRTRWRVAGAGTILFVQWVLIMPRLDERTLARIAGYILEPSSLHHWWIILDIARLGLYVLVLRRALLCLRSNQPNDALES
ncbi:hypothetical protein WJS89_10215 [Sphingomicrobium sp. XHP0235]|uniref:hypothetical protein n=1 Tax=Sphingomicrobium aquimarinum TaxID=3133971 RepID=UPI0031FEDD69